MPKIAPGIVQVLDWNLGRKRGKPYFLFRFGVIFYWSLCNVNICVRRMLILFSRGRQSWGSEKLSSDKGGPAKLFSVTTLTA